MLALGFPTRHWAPSGSGHHLSNVLSMHKEHAFEHQLQYEVLQVYQESFSLYYIFLPIESDGFGREYNGNSNLPCHEQIYITLDDRLVSLVT